MLNIDFDAHNHETNDVWAAFNAGNPIRVPVIIGAGVRYYLFSPWLNPRKISYQEYTEDPDLMLETQLEFQYYMRHNLLQDVEMGMPKESWPAVYVDLQNYYEAGWLGCPVRYHDGQVPGTAPILKDANKNMLFDMGIPDPFKAGVMARNLEYYEHFKDKLKEFTWMGLPVSGIQPCGLGTDGPFTVAANIRGATEICLDLYDDPKYAHELLSFITEATIARIKAWREYTGAEAKPERWGFADDSILLLSGEAYREFLLPYHKRLLSELAGAGPHSIHLCGDATRHFRTIRDELNVTGFDTGFPVDFGWLRKELGPDVYINGGPSAQFLQTSTPAQVADEVKRILGTGIMEGGRFVLREGNNMAPSTAPESINAMYKAALEFGRY